MELESLEQTEDHAETSRQTLGSVINLHNAKSVFFRASNDPDGQHMAGQLHDLIREFHGSVFVPLNEGNAPAATIDATKGALRDIIKSTVPLLRDSVRSRRVAVDALFDGH